jgi:prephenate dehydrogenase
MPCRTADVPAAILAAMRVGFLGFGLIGGSVARALRSAEPSREWELVGWSPSGDGPRRAVADGVLDDAPRRPADAVAGADLVVLAGPATACLRLLDDLGGPLADALGGDAVITDVASTKTALIRRADAAGLRYVGGHPMAGRETAGYEASSPDLFHDRPWVVVPGAVATEEDVGRVVSVARACGGRIVMMDAEAHDRAVAGVSHLPLILAAALVDAVAGTNAVPRPDWPLARDLAATGWRDMTRLARGDTAMGAAIAATNAEALAGRLRDVRAVLDDWLAELERPGGPDEDSLEARLRAVRDRLDPPS